MHATYEDMLEKGLDALFYEQLAAVFKDDGKSVICYFTPDLVDTQYATIVNYIPHKGNKIAHTIDEVPKEDAEAFFEAMRTSVKAISKVTEESMKKLRKMYIIQHIGPEEDNPHFFTRTTNFPLHFHIYATTNSILETAHQDKRLFRARSNFTFWDPTYFIVYDLLKVEFPEVALDKKTSSIILKEKKLSEYPKNASVGIEDSDIQLLSSIIVFWKALWKEVTSCFTDFSTDRNGRYLPFDRDICISRTNEFIEKYPELSNESKIALRYVSERILPSFYPYTKGVRHNFYKGINGSVGYTLDFNEDKVTLRFAPRTLLSEKYGATDGEFLRFRDRSRMLDTEDIRKILDVQRDIIKEINSIIA